MLTQRGEVARPVARFENLVVTETADEVLLYDTDKHHIHHLNTTTAAVWRHTDGTHSVTDIARLAGQELGADVDDATVRLALTKLDDAGLLKESLADGLRMSRMSRRTFVQRAGVAGAIAVPAIVSTTAASAQAPSPGDNPLCESGCRSWGFLFGIVEYDPCWVASDGCTACSGQAYGLPGILWWIVGSCAGNMPQARSTGGSMIEVSRDEVPEDLQKYLPPEEDGVGGDGAPSGEGGGSTDGTTDGTADGSTDGTVDGTTDGSTDGTTDGTADGSTDGTVDGVTDGTTDGATDGTTDDTTGGA